MPFTPSRAIHLIYSERSGSDLNGEPSLSLPEFYEDSQDPVFSEPTPRRQVEKIMALVGFIALAFVVASFAVIYLARDTERDAVSGSMSAAESPGNIWRSNFVLWLFIGYLIRHLPQVTLMGLLPKISPVFGRMPVDLQRHDCNLLVTFLVIFFWCPINMWVVHLIFQDRQEFQFGLGRDFSRVVIMAGMIGEWYDMTQRRKFDIMLHAHHFAATFIAILMFDKTPLEGQDPGIMILIVQSVLDRMVYFSMPLTHWLRQVAKDYPNDQSLSFINLRAIYKVIFWFYAVWVRLVTGTLLWMYDRMYGAFIPPMWRLLWPATFALFFLIDIDVYILFYREAYKKPNVATLLTTTPSFRSERTNAVSEISDSLVEDHVRHLEIVPLPESSVKAPTQLNRLESLPRPVFLERNKSTSTDSSDDLLQPINSNVVSCEESSNSRNATTPEASR